MKLTHNFAIVTASLTAAFACTPQSKIGEFDGGDDGKPTDETEAGAGSGDPATNNDDDDDDDKPDDAHPDGPPPADADCVDPQCLMWFRQLDLTGWAVDITSDSDHSPTVLLVQDEESDLAMVALDTSSVNERWTTVYSAPNDGSVYPGGLAQTPGGQYVTAAQVHHSTADDDFSRLAYYGSDGAEVWSVTMDIADLGIDDFGVFDVSVDGHGHILLAAGGQETSVLRQYDDSGALLWSTPFEFFSRQVNASTAGEVAVFGQDTLEGFALAVFTHEGTSRWSNMAPGNEGGDHAGHAVAFAPNGSVFVAGMLEESKEVLWGRRYNAGGEEMWTIVVDEQFEELVDIAIDPAGNVWWASTRGGTDDRGSTEDLWMRAYTPDGKELGTWTYDAGADEEMRALTVDDRGIWLLARNGSRPLLGRISHQLVNGG